MSDSPGPEIPLVIEQEDGYKLTANQLMAAFRSKLATGEVSQPRSRANGAGGHGAYNGRSGRFLKGKVKERHKMAVYLEAAGWKGNEIAAALGYTAGRVSIILNSDRPELKLVKEEARQRVLDNTIDLQAKFVLHAPTALNRMVEIMNQTGDVSNARLAARDILDRAGYSPVKKSAVVSTQVPFEQLAGTLSQIEKANQVVEERHKWEVQATVVEQDGAA